MPNISKGYCQKLLILAKTDKPAEVSLVFAPEANNQKGFSGFIPAILGLIQGAGNLQCDGDGQAVYLEPLFTVDFFFICIFCMTFSSLIAFTAINNVGRLHIYFTHCKEDGDVSKAEEKQEQDELIQHETYPSHTLFIMLMIGKWMSI